MISGRLLILLPALALSLLAGPAPGQQLVNLPDASWANDVTPDGEIVVGTWVGGSGFIWRWRVDPAPTIIPGMDAVGVSDDGLVVAGNTTHPTTGQKVATRWTSATGVQLLGTVGGGSGCGLDLSSAYDISGDGSTIVGLAWIGCKAYGFRWTAATGMQALQYLANGLNRCSAISGDGSALGGFAQGTFERTPAYWAPDTSGFVLNANFQGEVWGFNQDGSLSVGTNFFGGNNLTAFRRNTQTGVMNNLGNLTSGWNAQALDLSEDGNLVVGFDIKLTSRKAWVWTAADGMVSMNTRLLAAGITNAPSLQVCRAVSDDGTVIVGGGNSDGPFGYAGFIAELPLAPPPWTDLGSGLAGTNGVPVLDGTGQLTTGTATQVVLTQAKPGSPAAFVVGVSAAYSPFKQGVLVPSPNVVVVVPALSPTGSVSLQFSWPAGVPSNYAAYWQCLVSDPAAPAGYALSNALKSLTP